MPPRRSYNLRSRRIEGGTDTSSNNCLDNNNVINSDNNSAENTVTNFLIINRPTEIIDLLDLSRNTSISYILYRIGGFYNSDIRLMFVKLAADLRKIQKARLDRVFLVRCRYFDVVPKHISDVFRALDFVNIRDGQCRRSLNGITRSAKKRLLNLEIRDIHCFINSLKKRIHLSVERLREVSDPVLIEKFIPFHRHATRHKHSLHYNSLQKKLEQLRLQFDHTFISPQTDNNDTHATNPTTNRDDHNNNILNEVNEPVGATYRPNINTDAWVVNLSKTVLPQQVTDVLKLGPTFNFTTKLDRDTTFDILKQIEYSTYNIDNEELRNITKDHLLNVVNHNIRRKEHINHIDKELLTNINLTKRFLKTNDHLLVTRADKGNATVVMDKLDYIAKVESCLLDGRHYKVVDKDPTNILKSNMKKFLELWKSRGVFDVEQSFANIDLKVESTNLPRAYGLVKIHKRDFPVRIIVSAINSPSYSFDKAVSLLFNRYFPRPTHSVKNSLDLIKLTSDINITNTDTMISLDVVSLFTNIGKDLIFAALRKRWKYLRNKINLACHEFIEGIEVLIDNTYFRFNNVFYKQILGAPMGFCTSPWFAEITLELLENNCLESLKSDVVFYKRYVDDCFLIVKKDKTDHILSTFNEYNHNLQFTIEFENAQNQLSFLDVLFSRDNNNLITNWFRKPTSSGRYIHFASHHPFHQKIAIIYCLIDKAIKLSHSTFHQTNIQIVTELLINNGYPLNIIDKYIKKRITSIQHNNNELTTTTRNAKSRVMARKPKVILPFHKKLHTQFNTYLHRSSIIPIYRQTNKLNNIIRLGKDPLKSGERSHVVYKIDCKDCHGTYIGQTERFLSRRRYEHNRDIRINSTTSAVATHCNDYDHTMDVDNSIILASEMYKKPREFLEMLHIYFHDNTINRQQDTQFLKNVYKTTLHRLKDSLKQ